MNTGMNTSMNNDELALMDIAALAPLIGGGEVSPVEVMQSQLARIEALNPDLNAYISLYPDAALAAAKEAEDEALETATSAMEKIESHLQSLLHEFSEIEDALQNMVEGEDIDNT